MKKGPRRPTNPDRTRDRVLRVSAKLFADRGYGSTSMRDIARAAGVRESTLYHHCRSKDDLYREVNERTQRQIRSIVDGALATGHDFGAVVENAVDRMFTFYLRNRHLAKLSLRATLGDSLKDVDRSTNRWVGFLEGVTKQPVGGRNVKDLDPALLLITLDALMTYHSVARDSYLALFGKDVTNSEMAQRTKTHITRVIMRVLGVE